MAGAGASMLGSIILFTVILSLQQIYRGKLASSELFAILGGFTSSLLFLFSLAFIGTHRCADRCADFGMGVANKTPEFLEMNPIGKVPVLETPEGAIFESSAIARYVSRLKGENSLNGSSLIEYISYRQGR